MRLKSEFLREIKSRGFIYQASDIENLDKLISKNSITAYIGFDITSDSLHVGSLVQLMLLHWLDHYNHKTIALVGGGTTLVGDPSGKDTAELPVGGGTMVDPTGIYKSLFLSVIGNVGRLELAS